MTQNEIFQKHLKQAARFEIKVLKFTLSVNADPARKRHHHSTKFNPGLGHEHEDKLQTNDFK